VLRKQETKPELTMAVQSLTIPEKASILV